MRDLIVVGAGIIGATVAKVFQSRGANVLLLDDRREMGGTSPSGGHLKPSWFGGLPKKDYEPALELLDQTWGLHKHEFQVVGGVPTTVYRVDTDLVLAHHKTNETVLGVTHINNFPVVRTSHREERCRLLLIATGVWAGVLVPSLNIVSKQGVGFRVKGTITAPLIHPWAPYKQVVAHQQTPTDVWVGDGSSLKPENWTSTRTEQCLARCREATGLTGKAESRFGYRPYCTPENPTDPCLLRKLGPRAWVATGSGKSGTIAAGWVSRRILNANG